MRLCVCVCVLARLSQRPYVIRLCASARACISYALNPRISIVRPPRRHNRPQHRIEFGRCGICHKPEGEHIRTHTRAHTLATNAQSVSLFQGPYRADSACSTSLRRFKSPCTPCPQRQRRQQQQLTDNAHYSRHKGAAYCTLTHIRSRALCNCMCVFFCCILRTRPNGTGGI